MMRSALFCLLGFMWSFVTDAALAPHPRLLADRADFEAFRVRATNDTFVALGTDKLRANVELILKEPPLEHVLGGKRMLGVARRAVMRLTHLALVYRLDGDRRALDAASAELRNLADFPDWNPGHFLDTAELSLAVSIAYDWLYDDLDAETRERTAKALRDLALAPSYAGVRKWTFWLKGGGNWGQVCHTGMIAAALALGPEGTDRYEETIARATPAHHRNLDWYEPKGAYPVSPMYWSYETDFLSLASALQRKALGTDHGLSERAGFAATYAYSDYVTGPSGLLFNVCDAHPERYCDFAPWYGAWRYGKAVSPRDVALYRDFCAARPQKIPVDEGERLFALTLLYVRAPSVAAPELPYAWCGEGPNPLAVQRTSQDEAKTLYVGLKGGLADFPHGHMDAGSFVFERDGVRWAWEAGTPSYLHYETRGLDLGNRKKGGARWRAFHYNVFSHNTLVIDGHEQEPEGVATIEVVTNAPASEVRLDLSACYASDARRVTRVSRTLSDGRRWQLEDRLEGLRPGAQVRWAMLTRAKAWVAGDGCLVLKEGDRRLVIEPRGDARKPSWKIERNPCPNPEIDPPLKGFTQVSFTLTAPESGRLKFQTVFR